MTSRLTMGTRLKIPETPYISGIFEIKEHDSYCYFHYNSSFTGGGHA